MTDGLMHFSGFVKAHWKEDWYFGYQCLNGCNPLLVRQTRLLPPNLAVTSDMLRPFLPGDSSLELELQVSDPPSWSTSAHLQSRVESSCFLTERNHLPAGLRGFGQSPGQRNQREADVPVRPTVPAPPEPAGTAGPHRHPGELLTQVGKLSVDFLSVNLSAPVLQLQQKPDPQNPIFLPSDSTCDWLLAKMWVHNADFQYHQLISHYLRTHMMSELCCIATLRQLAESHPLHQVPGPPVLLWRIFSYLIKLIFDQSEICRDRNLPQRIYKAKNHCFCFKPWKDKMVETM